jgi:hypothetical protein
MQAVLTAQVRSRKLGCSVQLNGTGKVKPNVDESTGMPATYQSKDRQVRRGGAAGACGGAER